MKRSSVHEFALEVDRVLEAFPWKDYHEKVGRAKKMREELYPMSRLGLSFKQPGLDVQIEAFEDSARADGHIWITGYYEANFEIQATFAGYSYEDFLRSELLVQQGFSPGAGPIERNKKTGAVVATMAAQDMDAPIHKLAKSIRERLAAKLNKTYASGTVLLIAFEDMKLRGRGWWSLLFTALDCGSGIEKGNFAQIYLFNSCTNELMQVA